MSASTRSPLHSLTALLTVAALASCTLVVDQPSSEPEPVESLASSLVTTPCADGTSGQVFGGDMSGCKGRVAFGQAASLCGSGYHVATANEWSAWHDNKTPAYQYWTRDSLRHHSGVSKSCIAGNEIAGGSVLSSGPLHVCTTATTDPLGNKCDQIKECGLDASAPNLHLGGTAGSAAALAGALCVKDQCASGAASQTFGTDMVGCAGSVPYAQRGNLCASGWHVASVEEWVAKKGSVQPLHTYWTNDDLKLTGTVSNNCAASFDPNVTPALNTGKQTLRVCNGAVDDEGNRCSISGCGLTTITPNRFLGAGSGAVTAGALCVHSYSDAVPPHCASSPSTQACGTELWPITETTFNTVVIPVRVMDPVIKNAVQQGMDAWTAVLSPRIKFTMYSGQTNHVVVKCIRYLLDANGEPIIDPSTNPPSPFCDPNGSGGGEAAIGFGAGGVRNVNLDSNVNVNGASHELGHIIGLWHEHLRTDRDRFIQPSPTYLTCGQVSGNWAKCDPGARSSMLGAYDLNSTMQYQGENLASNIPIAIINKRGASPPAHVTTGMGTPTTADAAKVLEMYAVQLDPAWTKGVSLSRDVGGRVPRNVNVAGSVKPKGRPAPVFPGASGNVDYFVRGGDHIYYRSRDTNNIWGAYTDLGGSFDTDPAGVSWGQGNAIVIAGKAGKLKWRKYNSGWEPSWQTIPDPSPAMALNSSPAAVSWAPNVLHLFIRTTSGLAYNVFANNVWQGWTPISPATPAGVTFSGSPTVASQGVDELNVYVAGSDQAIYSTWYSTRFGGWQGAWLKEVHCCIRPNTSPTATARGSRVDLLWHDTGSRALYWKYATFQWFGPYQIGSVQAATQDLTANSSPVAVTISPSAFEVFSIGADGGLWERPFGRTVPYTF